jgi:hypothetical protein
MARLRGPQGGLNEIESQAVRNINAGTTRYQQKRAFGDRLMMGGIQAGLTGAQGLVSAYGSMDLQEQQKLKAQKEAKYNADKLQASQNKEIRKSAEQYAAGEYVPPGPGPGEDIHATGVGRPVPAWLEAENALNRQQLNSAAELSTIGGYNTPKGRQNDADQSDMLTRDIGTAQGIMGSLTRRGY